MADSEAKWYILHTYSGYEKKVAEDIKKVVENRSLQHLIEDVMVPTTKRTETKDGGKVVEVEEKVYPGYVFVKMVKTDESWQLCRSTRGVTGFVGPESKPTPLSEEEVRNLESGSKETKNSFEVGEKVVIKAGYLEDFEGVIKEIYTDEETNRMCAVVDVYNMFGEVTPTNVELNDIRKKDND